MSCTRPTIWILDQYLRNQDGIHLSGIHMVGLSGIQMVFEYWTIWHPTSFRPFEYWTSLVFRSPLKTDFLFLVVKTMTEMLQQCPLLRSWKRIMITPALFYWYSVHGLNNGLVFGSWLKQWFCDWSDHFYNQDFSPVIGPWLEYWTIQWSDSVGSFKSGTSLVQ